MADESRKSILQMARGAIMERVDYEMAKVLDNILDANTKPEAVREVTLTMKFKPDAERTNISAAITAKSKLVPTNPVQTSLYIAGSSTTGEVQAVEMVPQIPGQLSMDDNEQEAPATLNVINFR